MLPKLSQIVNRLYAFIYETTHSKSGLGLPSIVALVMVIDDKSWTLLERHERAFYIGLEKFVDHCKPLVNSVGKIRCPCKSCRTILWVSIKHLSDHIMRHGFDLGYKTWVHHGEPALPLPPPVIDNTRQPQMSDMTALLNDLSYIPPNNEHNEPTQGDIGETSNEPTKDTGKARQDLQRLGIRSGLWLGQTKNGKCLKPQAAYSFTLENRKKFCQFIKGVKVPDGFGSCFKHKVTDNDTNITGLKSHDCHIMMQRLLPYGLQNYLPDKIAKPIIELYSLFKQICSTTLMEDDMLKAQIKVVDIMCDLEIIYPPALFDIMIHLVIHLPLEALEGGPIRPRWMFPFERYMKKLKGYVRNKAKPEGSIAEGYVAEEALTFSSHYFRDVFRSVCKSIGLRSVIRFDAQELKKVKWYVLHNSPEIDTYRSQFKSLFPNKDMKEEFPEWFGSQIRQRHVDNDKDLEVSTTSELFALACGPTWTPISINVYVVDGVSLNDLDNATLHIDGQSMEVDAPPYIIDVVDQDDDITDDEDALPHDLANSDDEDLINVDDDVDVARSHGGDDGGEDRPPPHHVLCGCMGCFPNRGKGKQKPNLGGRAVGRLNTRDKTWNLSLKEVTDKKGPIPIRFELRDKQTVMPLGDHATHWSSYIGEVIRGVPFYYPSWLKVTKEQKAALITDIGTQFDLRPHLESPDWTEINAGIQQHLQKGNDPRNIARAAQNWQNQAKSTVISRQGSRSLARLRDEMRQSSGTQEYPSLIDTFFVAHTVNGEFLRDEDRRIYEEMRRLEATGTYTDDEINRLARRGKQRGHIPGVGRVLPARATAGPSTPASESTLNSLHKKVDFMMSLFKSDSKYSDMFSQFESGGASGSGGCGDDEESADDQEDEDEDGDGDS
ncbi:DIE2/ALG10 family protein [Tanacetum coccineum]